LANCPKPAEEASWRRTENTEWILHSPTEAWLAKLKTGQPGFGGEILLSFFFLYRVYMFEYLWEILLSYTTCVNTSLLANVMSEFLGRA
jgi:hypothetical protein